MCLSLFHRFFLYWRELEVITSISYVVIDSSLVNVFTGVDNHDKGIIIELLNRGAKFIADGDALYVLA